MPLFTEDIALRGGYYALVIRSAAPRGRLKGIECPRLGHSYRLITAEDIPGKNRLADFPVPVLASGSVSYAGEPAALLAGPDKIKLEEYAGQCKVLVEEESAVFSYSSFPPEDVLARRDIRWGDTENSFAKAALVVEGTYRTSIQEHWYSEPTGAAVLFSQDGNNKSGRPRLIVHTATQWPFHVKRSVISVLNLKPDEALVKPSALGIHLDGKVWYPSLTACHAALAAFILKKPVKLMLTREEDFRYSPKRNGAEITIRSALGDRGQLLGTELRVITNMGAAGFFTEEILDRICLGALGAYPWDAAVIQGFAVKTNIPPAGPFAGFGLAQGFFAMERHASRIADTLRLDPAEWRKQAMFSKHAPLAVGVIHKDRVPLEELLDTTAAMSDYYRKWASFELLRIHRREKAGRGKKDPLRGIGVAAAYQGSGLLYPVSDKGLYSVELTLDKNSSLEIRTSMVSSDQEYIYRWQNIAAEILTLETGAVRVVQEGETVPDTGPAVLSRNITVITRLVERACAAIRKQRFRDPLPITVRRSCRPLKASNWAGAPVDQNAFSHISWGAAVVEIEIDPIDYTPRIRGAWLGVDGGRILSENKARRALTLGTIHALGWASREELVYEEGKIPDAGFRNSGVPAPGDIPPIHIDFVWNDSANSKGIGELPFNCVPAAYVQAVSQAMDYPFEKIPVTAKDIWDARKKAEEKEREA